MKKLTMTVLLMILSLSVLTGSGPEAIVPAGAGTEENPYQIASWQNLYWLSQNSGEWNKHYVQTVSLVFPESINSWDDNKGWTPIGNNSTAFTGVYNGVGNTVSGLFINRPEIDYQGLFGNISGINTLIENIGVLDVDITAKNYVGGIIGCINGGTLKRSYSTGSINGNQYVGGLTGANYQVISQCFTSVNVAGASYAGGAIGITYYNTSITQDTYSSGSVTRKSGTNSRFGGFVGGSENSASISNSYSTGIVIYSGTSNPTDKGFVGHIFDLVTFENCFWDMETSGQSTSIGGDNVTGKSSEQMKTQSTFTNWNFENIWTIAASFNAGYPYLQWRVFPPENSPSIQAANIVFNHINYNRISLSWSNGNGDKRIVFAKQAGSGTAGPIDNTVYTANTVFGEGSEIAASGWFCVYNGLNDDVTVTGLTPNTEYIFHVIEYNGNGPYALYNNDTAGNNPGVQVSAVLTTPSVQSDDIIFSNVTHSQMTINWTNGDGSKRVVFAKQASSGTVSPQNNTTYIANSHFGSGTELDNWFCVYNGTGNSVVLTGLTEINNYIIQIFEYNGSSGSENYLTETTSNNPKAQMTSTSPVDYLFTNCSQTGKSGPSQEQVNQAYTGTNLEGNVSVANGIQEWVVPESGIYTIEVTGAKGGSWTGNEPVYGGNGAKITGDFELTAGTTLYILVGQKGTDKTSGTPSYNGFGGGGGSYVYTLNAELPLIAAGGGGGAYAHSTLRLAGIAGTNATDGVSVRNAEGGSSGTGGGINANYAGGGGAGYLGNGETGNLGGVGGKKPSEMGIGGTGYSSYGTEGGFGGGGGGSCAGGGGGGYSGGAGGVYSQDYYGGGGGGSYNSGTNQINLAGVNDDHGYVKISKKMSTVIFTDGSNFNPQIIPGSENQRIGRFNLIANETGAFLNEVSIKLNDFRSGISNFKLWYSNDIDFNSETGIQLGSTITDDPGIGNSINFVLNHEITVEGGYYFVTVDVSNNASGTIRLLIENTSDIIIQGGVLSQEINNAMLSGSNATLPVTLSSFTATYTASNTVSIMWTTESESNMIGYHILRAKTNELDTALRMTKNIIIALNQPETQQYSFQDKEIETDTEYFYWLQSAEYDGTIEFFGPISIKTQIISQETPVIPLVTQLNGAYPNPFNPSTTISFDIAEKTNVTIDIFNIKGQKVKSLVNQEIAQGRHSVIWNGLDNNHKRVATGVYFYIMQAGQYTQINKMLMMK